MANAHKIGDLVMARQSELGEPEKFAFGVIIDEKNNMHQYKVHWFDWDGDNGRWQMVYQWSSRSMEGTSK
jgi:hypothetical protein